MSLTFVIFLYHVYYTVVGEKCNSSSKYHSRTRETEVCPTRSLAVHLTLVWVPQRMSSYSNTLRTTCKEFPYPYDYPRIHSRGRNPGKRPIIWNYIEREFRIYKWQRVKETLSVAQIVAIVSVFDEWKASFERWWNDTGTGRLQYSEKVFPYIRDRCELQYVTN
jgi:hypothetical protein